MYSVQITAGSGSAFKVKSKDYEFTIDTEGKGINPPDTLLASLGSCIGVYIHKYLSGVNLGKGEFTISLEAEFTKEAPLRFQKINATLDLKNLRLDERRQKALLEFIKNCPVHNTLKTDPAVEIRII